LYRFIADELNELNQIVVSAYASFDMNSDWIVNATSTDKVIEMKT
jgi:hypothetical protein